MFFLFEKTKVFFSWSILLYVLGKVRYVKHLIPSVVGKYDEIIYLLDDDDAMVFAFVFVNQCL